MSKAEKSVSDISLAQANPVSTPRIWRRWPAWMPKCLPSNRSISEFKTTVAMRMETSTAKPHHRIFVCWKCLTTYMLSASRRRERSSDGYTFSMSREMMPILSISNWQTDSLYSAIFPVTLRVSTADEGSSFKNGSKQPVITRAAPLA